MSALQAGQHPSRRQVELGLLLHLLLLLLWAQGTAALADFSGYLTKLLQNHTVYACDGDRLSLQCPRHSTISVQSAYYGQAYQLCTEQQPEAMMKEPLNCVASTTLQKVLDECQDLRACQLPVNSWVFGPDLCPGITKYLIVSFKCKPRPNPNQFSSAGVVVPMGCVLHSVVGRQSQRPSQDMGTYVPSPGSCIATTPVLESRLGLGSEYKTRSVCENEELKLHCKESKFLNIYSASYGRFAQERNICSTAMDRLPQFDCFSYTALDVLSKKCYGKQRCKIIANNHNFGRPCLPGVKKYLNVSYACVPKFIFAEVNPMVTNLNPSWTTKEDVNFDPKESRFPKKDGIIVSNSLATFAYIKDHPERAALLFVSSVCVGLVFTLCALVIHVSCTKDSEKLQRKREYLVPEDNNADETSEEEEEEEERESSDSDFPDELTGFCRTSYSAYCSVDSAELAERIERREQIIQEICMSSGLDMSPTRSLSPFFINEQQCICFG